MSRACFSPGVFHVKGEKLVRTREMRMQGIMAVGCEGSEMALCLGRKSYVDDPLVRLLHMKDCFLKDHV